MAIGAFVGLVGFSSAFQQQWMRIYSSSGTDISVIQGTFLNTTLNESATAKLWDLPVVAQAPATIYNLMNLTSDVNALVYGWNADAFQLDSLQILTGRRFRDGQREVMLGDVLAQDLNEKPGDTLDLQGTEFKVTAIYHGASTLEAAAVIMPLEQLQQLSGMEGKVSTIDVRLRPAPAGPKRQTYPWGLLSVLTLVPTPDIGFRDTVAPAVHRDAFSQVENYAFSPKWSLLNRRAVDPQV